ncbi:hypothetical protein, partial [Thiolapillus sp.]|uniref:hypothetical protein n=1 Tax=Thiolapillus sp. TaxID=2017437 RepID=UPI003AF68B53
RSEVQIDSKEGYLTLWRHQPHPGQSLNPQTVVEFGGQEVESGWIFQSFEFGGSETQLSAGLSGHLLVSWYFEPSQPQRATSWLKTMFNLSHIYSARKSSNHKLSINHKITHDTNLHKTKHTQTSDIKFSKN